MKNIVFLLFIPFLSFSQSISKQVISTAGEYFFNDNAKLNFTSGETFVGNMTSEDNSIQIGNGYYESLDLTTLSNNIPDLELNVNLFPNPTDSYISIKYPSIENLSLIIYDINGKQINKFFIKSNQIINISALSNGIYLIKILMISNNKSKLFKLIKK